MSARSLYFVRFTLAALLPVLEKNSMKLGIASVVIVCMTGIFTYKVFLNFQKRWKEAEAFQSSFLKAPYL